MKLVGLALVFLACRSAPAPRPQVPPAQPGVETVVLDGARGSATSQQHLARGELYLLEATGAVTVGARHLDAEYLFDGAQPEDATGGVDAGIDIGQQRVLPATGRKAAPASGERVKWFGAYRADHVYHLIATGTGGPLVLRLLAPGPAVGTLAVSIRRLTPAPPALGAPLETILVPARERVSVRSAIAPALGAVYLLQAVGEVQVGGVGHMGDAEFHDYHSDGSGYNEGEAGVDFGVGVDDPELGAPGTGSGHVQRQRKWGQFRPDHTYYLLYAGTGGAIGLNYHDTGGRTGVFKDNDGFLPVSIFAMP
jgi:hypothetical protein